MFSFSHRCRFWLKEMCASLGMINVFWKGGMSHFRNLKMSRSWLKIRDRCGSSMLLACLHRAYRAKVEVDWDRRRFVVRKRFRFVDDKLKRVVHAWVCACSSTSVGLSCLCRQGCWIVFDRLRTFRHNRYWETWNLFRGTLKVFVRPVVVPLKYFLVSM